MIGEGSAEASPSEQNDLTCLNMRCSKANLNHTEYLLLLLLMGGTHMYVLILLCSAD